MPLNKARIADLHHAMAGYTERRAIPGIVTLVAQGDDVHVDAVGTLTKDGTEPMRRDTIFRIASTTKPIAAAAVMILIDDCKLSPDDSVEQWIPELANRRVLRKIESDLHDTVPANRPITVRDVLNSTFGFGSVMAMPDTYPIQRPIAEWHLGGDGPPHPSLFPATDEWMRLLGSLPLMHQPGQRWLYNASCDIMGVLVARVSGQTFGAFLQERLFGPLGMKDTDFSVPTTKLDRLAGIYYFDQQTQELTPFDDEQDSEYSQPPAFESGSGGLVSTVDDYFAFCRMMLNRGSFGGQRILSESAVAAMTKDQLTPDQRGGAEIFFGNHSSWGYGMSVCIGGDKPWMVPGRFGWDGGFGLSAYSDPKNGFVGILMTQRMMDSPEPPPVFGDFWTLAYGALEN